MKLQIDTDSKTIKIEQDIKLSVLIKNLKGMFPGGEWKNFTLETNTVIQHWNNPIIIDRPYPVYPSPQRDYPWYNKITWGGDIRANMQNCKLNSGTYNVEFNK